MVGGSAVIGGHSVKEGAQHTALSLASAEAGKTKEYSTQEILHQKGMERRGPTLTLWMRCVKKFLIER